MLLSSGWSLNIFRACSVTYCWTSTFAYPPCFSNSAPASPNPFPLGSLVWRASSPSIQTCRSAHSQNARGLPMQNLDVMCRHSYTRWRGLWRAEILTTPQPSPCIRNLRALMCVTTTCVPGRKITFCLLAYSAIERKIQSGYIKIWPHLTDDISKPGHAGQWQKPVGKEQLRDWPQRSELRAAEFPCN